MSVWKIYSISMLKLVFFLIIGFYLTITMLKQTYESMGISFAGDVWVNWFGVSYFLFFLYTIIGSSLFNSDKAKERISSIFFWLFFIGALYVMIIPFVKGENPF